MVQTANTNPNSAPLNVTKKALKTTHITLTAGVASPSGGLLLQPTTKDILIIPQTLTTPLFVRFGEGAVSVASASNNESDRVVVDGRYPAFQEEKLPETTHISLFSVDALIVSVIELD